MAVGTRAAAWLPLRAARAGGRRRRGGSRAQGARRAALARARPRCSSGSGARGREPPREPRAEPRELGGAPGTGALATEPGRAAARGRRSSASALGRRSCRRGEPLARASATPARAALGRGGSVLLVLNRLGFAPDPGLRGVRGRAPVRALPRWRSSTIGRRAPSACRLCGLDVPGGEPLRPLPRPAAPARSAGAPSGSRPRRARRSPRRASSATTRRSARRDAETARAAFRSGAARVLVGTSMALRLAEETPVAVGALVLADATLEPARLPRRPSGPSSWRWRLAETVEAGRERVAPVVPAGAPGARRPWPGASRTASTSRSGPSARSWATRRRAGWRGWCVEGRDAGAARRGSGRARAGGGRAVLGPATLAGGPAPGRAARRGRSSRRPWPRSSSPCEAGAGSAARGSRSTSTRSSSREGRYTDASREGGEAHGSPGGAALRRPGPAAPGGAGPRGDARRSRAGWTTWSRRCTPRWASGSPRPRSASSSGCSWSTRAAARGGRTSTR